MLFNIYAGLSGGFGGANYIGTMRFATKDEAEAYARETAIQEYQSYEGSHGILNWEECREDLIDSWEEEPYSEDVDEKYLEEVESWIEYHVEFA